MGNKKPCLTLDQNIPQGHILEQEYVRMQLGLNPGGADIHGCPFVGGIRGGKKVPHLYYERVQHGTGGNALE